jgi:5-(carboxyamino)imidazole ribonucleotide synthase
MLCWAAAPLGLETHVLDPDANAPAAGLASHFVQGDFNDAETVFRFGRGMGVVTIEIEHVSIAALHRLRAEGVLVHPSPDALATIQDKGLQKDFYKKNGLPSAPHHIYKDAEALREAVRRGEQALPFVQKARRLGYDGRGVAVVRQHSDLATKLLDVPCLVEELVEIEKELAVIVARNAQGQVAAYPLVEMHFGEATNLLEILVCPADLPPQVAEAAYQLAKQTIEAFGLCGLLAVEMFWAKDGRLLINEVAPRTHNSGHHTIEACATSQFEQQLRAVLGWPLGGAALRAPAAMVNLLGEPGHEGAVRYEGLEGCLAIKDAHLHLYGKAMTKPFRKMGHITLLADTREAALEKAAQAKCLLRVVSG